MQTEEDRNRIIEIGATSDKTQGGGKLKIRPDLPSLHPKSRLLKWPRSLA